MHILSGVIVCLLVVKISLTAFHACSQMFIFKHTVMGKLMFHHIKSQAPLLTVYEEENSLGADIKGTTRMQSLCLWPF